MGRPKLDMSDFADSNVFFHVLLKEKGLGSVHEKFEVWTGPIYINNFHDWINEWMR